MSSLTGNIAPAPGRLKLTITTKDTNEPWDVPNAEIRLRSPSGALVTLAITRVSKGVYVAGSVDAPVVLDGKGTWKAEGHSPVIGDLLYPDKIEVVVESDDFPAGSAPLQPAIGPTDGNPFARWTTTTTDATPTRLVHIPIGPGEGIFTAGGALVLRPSDGLSALMTGGGVARRIGTAAPAWDTSPSGPSGSGYGDGTWASVWTGTGLAGVSAAWVLNADSIDMVVTGLVGSTLRWTLFGAPAWQYL